MINVVYCFDNNVIEYFMASLCSLLLHKKEATHYHIHCICSDKTSLDVSNIEKLVECIDEKSKIYFVSCISNFALGYEIRNITKATYYRFDIAEIFPDITKAIYLDVDTLIMEDLNELWQTDLEDNYLLGVKADVNIYSSWENKKNQYEYWKELKGWRGGYINAGVLLLNLDKIRSSRICEKWRAEIGKEYFYQDQDIINITCKPYIGFLPMKYNYMTFYTEADLEKLDFQNIYSRDEIDQARNNPVIIHYAGRKPWFDLDTKMGDEWWEFVLKCSYTADIFKSRYEQLNKIYVSIIIPAYNAEKYVRECLESILNQDTENYEVICINDGSTDRTLSVLQEYENRFYNMKIINQEHQGLSVARNSGLKIARGKYVYFVDADDTVVESFIAKAYSIATKDSLDVLLFSFENQCDEIIMQKKYNEQIKKVKRTHEFADVIGGMDMMYQQLRVDEYYPMVWIQFVNRKILVDQFILFYKGIVFEDVLYTYRLLRECKRVKCIKDIGYIKRIHSESICGREENLHNVISLWENLKKIIAINRDALWKNDKELYVLQAMTERAKNQFLRHYKRLNTCDKETFKQSLGFDKILLELFVI